VSKLHDSRAGRDFESTVRAKRLSQNISMTSEAPDEERLFLSARLLSRPDERMAFLQRECHSDPNAIQRVLALLEIDTSDRNFLESPVVQTSITRELLSPHVEAGSQIGQYRLREPLGAGGMGIVWLAEQTVPITRQVALKLIRSEFLAEEHLQRFDTERQTLARLDHPGITRLLDAGATPEGRPWFVMELVEGRSITEYCETENPPTTVRIRLMQQLCEAIHHSHQRRVVHRDLKPSNVLVRIVDGQPVVKVIDFGVAMTTSLQPGAASEAGRNDSTADTSELNNETPRQVLGTLAYMSPEQTTEHAEITPAADVYALGALLYQLLTGVFPLEGPDWKAAGLTERKRIVRDVLPTPPSQRMVGRPMPSELAKDLDAIAMKALQKNAVDRYASARDLSDDLGRLLANLPVRARTPSLRYSVRKLIRRQRTRMLAGVIGGVLLIFSAVMAWQHGHREGTRSEQVDLAGVTARQHHADYARSRQDVHREWIRGRNNEVRARLTEVRLPGDVTHSSDAASAAFEDRLLLSFCRTESQRLHHHRGKVFALAYSPDGRLLVSCGGGDESLVVIQDSATGAILQRLTEFKNDVNTACFSADGKILVTGDEDRLVRFWNLETSPPSEVRRIEGLTSPVAYVHLSADGQTISLAETDWQSLWSVFSIRDAANGNRLYGDEDFRLLHIDEQHGLAAVAGVNGEIQIRRYPEMSHVQTFSTRLQEVTCGVISPDGEFLAVGSRSGQLFFWNLKSGSSVELEYPLPKRNSVRDLRFSHDGQQLIVAHNDGVVRFWDVLSRTQQSTFSVTEGEEGTEAWSVAVSPDGRQIAVGFQDGTVRLLDFEHPFHGMNRHASVNALPFGCSLSLDQTLLAVIGNDRRTMELRHAETGDLVQTFSAPDKVQLAETAICPDNSKIWVTDVDHRLYAGDVTSGRLLPFESRIPGFFGPPITSPDQRFLGIAAPPGPVLVLNDGLILDATSWEPVFRMTVDPAAKQPSMPRPVEFLDEQHVLTYQGQLAHVWNFTTGQQVGHTFSDRAKWVMYASSLGKPERILVATDDATMHIWNPFDGTIVASLVGHRKTVSASAVSPDQQTLVTGSEAGEIKIWHLPTGDFLFDLFGTTGRIDELRFDSSGQRLLVVAGTSDARTEVLTWDTQIPRK
jgi:WD40 repeat protein/serine/threonine protein kinase